MSSVIRYQPQRGPFWINKANPITRGLRFVHHGSQASTLGDWTAGPINSNILTKAGTKGLGLVSATGYAIRSVNVYPTVGGVFSIFAVANHNGSLSGSQTLLDDDNTAPGGNSRNFQFRVNNGAVELIRFATTGSPYFATGAALSSATLRSGIHAGAVCNGTSIASFANGVKTSSTISGTPSTGNNVGDWRIGNFKSGSNTPFDGPIQLMMVWDRALSDAEMASLNANPWQVFLPEVEDLLEPVSTSVDTPLEPVTEEETITGYAGTLSQTANQSISPTAAALVLAGYAHTVVSSASQAISPATKALVLSGFAPALTQSNNKNISPAPASEVLAGFVPSFVQTNNQSMVPATKAETITGYAGTVNVSVSFNMVPATAAEVIASYAGAFAQPINLTPATAVETLTGYSNSLGSSANRELSPANAGIVITGFAPTLLRTANQSMIPATAVEIETKPAFTLGQSNNRVLTPASAGINRTGYAPNLVQSSSSNVSLVPATKAQTLTGYAPSFVVTVVDNGGGENGGCPGGSCGTGGWNGPKPGDPDNNVFLSARAVFSGIVVSWSYPVSNPHAVAYTKVYRGTVDDFSLAVLQGQSGSSTYLDPVNPPTSKEYFYWIQIMSVNGTLGDTIGPASAIAKPQSAWNLESLTGLIDAGVLATTLKTQINRIPEIDDKIFQEIEDRLAANVALANILQLVQNATDETLTLVNQEVTQRQDADGAFVDSINLLYAQYQSAAAAILEEKTIRVTKDEALASSISSLGASLGDASAALVAEQTARTTADEALAQSVVTLNANLNTATAAIITEQTARVNADSAQATLITDLYTKTDQNKAAIQNEQTTRTNADSAMASNISTLFTTTGENTAAIQNEAYARSYQDGVLASDINTVYVTLGNNLSSAISQEAVARITADGALASLVNTTEANALGQIAQTEVRMENKITITDGKVTSIGALYTAKVNVNGLIGGFGVYNNGFTVEAGFDVDMFWIGRTNADKVKPFIIAGGTVYIDEARIREAAIDTLKVAGGSITSLEVGIGGSNSVAAGGSTTLCAAGVFLPANASGVAITVTVALNSVNNSGQLMSISKDGVTLGSSGLSLMGGFATSGTFTVFDKNPYQGNNSYSFVLSNPTSGPGSNQAASVTTSSICVTGAKR